MDMIEDDRANPVYFCIPWDALMHETASLDFCSHLVVVPIFWDNTKYITPLNRCLTCMSYQYTIVNFALRLNMDGGTVCHVTLYRNAVLI